MAFGSRFSPSWHRKPKDVRGAKNISKPKAGVIRHERGDAPQKSATVIRHTRPSKPNKKALVTIHRHSSPSQPVQIQAASFIPIERPEESVQSRVCVVILSAKPDNLRACLAGVFKNEPGLVGRVIVVDDGASKGLEDLPGVIWVKGKKPFIFARNANIGIQRANFNDVILLNDDAILMTPGGFTNMENASRQRPNMGLCSAAVKGHVGNPNQNYRGLPGVRFEEKKLAFVCVYMPGAVLQEVGSLDERFVGYGYEDDDYCLRVKNSGFSIGVFDGCVVEHGSIQSTFRAKSDYAKLITENRLRYEEKWKVVRP
jgi:hypothetical protein